MALAGSFALSSSIANAETVQSPFAVTPLTAGYMLTAGEGSCGGDKGDKEGEASCGGDKEGEASCGGDKEGEASCGGDKEEAEGSCGEGSCGADTGA